MIASHLEAAYIKLQRRIASTHRTSDDVASPDAPILRGCGYLRLQSYQDTV